MDQQIYFAVAVTIAALVFTGVFAGVMLLLSKWFPAEEGNRPAPPDVVANREAARQEALRRLADRQRLQQQREASARISRGF